MFFNKEYFEQNELEKKKTLGYLYLLEIYCHENIFNHKIIVKYKYIVVYLLYIIWKLFCNFLETCQACWTGPWMTPLQTMCSYNS